MGETECPSCRFGNPDGFKYCGACGCSLLTLQPERRQLTVMFCDLVGSAALSERLDPESLRDLIGAVRERCTRAVGSFGGVVAQFYGDGMEVYFGYPRAHEDDPLRAVCAGLEVVRAQRDASVVSAKESLQIRVGIHTGLVVVGEMGQGRTRDLMPSMGATPNLAARLQSLAPPGGVVISAETLDLCKGGVHVVPMGRHALKGFSAPRDVFKVLSVSGLGPQPQPAPGTSTPLVGRDAELGVLEAAWEGCVRGRLRTVLLSGDAGIGKTRLVNALATQVSARAGTLLVVQCSALYRASALHPIAALALARLGLDPEDDTSAQALTARLATVVPEHLAVPLAPLLLSYGTVMGGDDEECPVADAAGAPDLSGALYELLAHCPARAPTLLVVEDLHWADAASRELLRRFTRDTREAPLLCVFTARGFTDMDADGGGQAVRVALDGLDRDGVREMVRGLTGASRVSEDALDEICTRTDGIPLFVEEMTRALLTAERLVHYGELLCLAPAADALPLPSSLRDLLTARVDSLADLKPLAQLASVVGREFRLRLLAAVAQRDPEQVQHDLGRLEDAGILVRPLGQSAPVFRFKHVLIQEAAYDTLLMSRRQEMHTRVAEVIIESFPDLAHSHPEVPARHFAAAGAPSRAVPFWTRAGTRALRNGAYREAMAQFSRALTRLLLEAENEARDRRELELQLHLATALTAARGHAAPEVEACYARADVLCKRLGEAVTPGNASLRARGGLQSVYFLRGPMQQAMDHAREFHDLAAVSGDTRTRVQALRRTGLANFAVGRFRDAREQLLRSALMTTGSDDASPLGEDAGEDSGDALVLARISLAWTDWFLGHAERARGASEAAVAAARRGSRVTTQAFAYCVAAAIHQCRDEPEATHRFADSANQIACQQGLSYWGAWARILYGHAVAARGDPGAGIAAMLSGLDAYHESGARLLLPHGFALLAQARHRAGQPVLALDHCRAGLESSAASGARFFDVELRRLEAVIELELGEPESAAESRLWHAIELARSQGAILLEMRAAVEFARLTRSVEVLQHVRMRLRKVNAAA